MTYNPEYISSYFDDLAEKEWIRLERSPVDEIKLWVHLAFLRRFITPGSRVLEVGAGPGRFTRELARLGCAITVVDISPVQLDLNRSRAMAEAYAEHVEGWHRFDVISMQEFPSEAFDAVLCYGGPISYALDQRRQAALECARVLKTGGMFLLSVMSLWGSAHSGLSAVMAEPLQSTRIIIETGDITDSVLPGHQHPCHMFRADELRRSLQDAGFDVSAMAASNCISTGWQDELTEIRADPELWRQVLEIELEACQEPGCIDMGTHMLAAGIKTNGGKGTHCPLVAKDVAVNSKQ